MAGHRSHLLCRWDADDGDGDDDTGKPVQITYLENVSLSDCP